MTLLRQFLLSETTVDLGLVKSLARPGGNVTGVTLMMQDVTAKQLEFLKEAVPLAGKVGVLLQTDLPFRAQSLAELERAAGALDVSVIPVSVDAARDLPRLFDNMTAAGMDAYFVLADPLTVDMRTDIATLALRHHLPGAIHKNTDQNAAPMPSHSWMMPHRSTSRSFRQLSCPKRARSELHRAQNTPRERFSFFQTPPTDTTC